MPSILDWLDAPDATRGIRYATADGGWDFRPYHELARDAYRVAGLLRSRGAPRGGVASLLLSEPQAFVPAFLGSMLAGLTPSPIASPFTFHDFGQYAEHVNALVTVAEPAVLLSDEMLADLAAAAAQRTGTGTPITLPDLGDLPADESARADPAELALLQFTSGSSGTPKGVQVTAGNLDANVGAILSWLGITPEDSCSSWLPLYHDMGLIGTLLCSIVGQIDLWLMTPVDFIRSPLRWLECHGRLGATITTAPNFGYAYAAKRTDPEQLTGLDFTGWRVAMNGAERIDQRAAAAFTTLLAPYGFRPSAFSPCYGMAEATLAVTGVPPAGDARMIRLAESPRIGAPVVVAEQGLLGVDAPASGSWLAACGTPVPGSKVEIVDDDGRPQPDGHFGEIRVGGPSVARGYRSAAGTEAFTPEGLRTGDAGFLLDGELYVVGRIGDSLKVRGRKVHAEDLETALCSVPGVQSGRVAVVLGSTEGTDHALVLVESEHHDWLDGVLTHLRAALDDTVRTTVVRGERGAIPRTSSGKPQRRLIWRRVLRDGPPAEVVHTPARSPLSSPTPA